MANLENKEIVSSVESMISKLEKEVNSETSQLYRIRKSNEIRGWNTILESLKKNETEQEKFEKIKKALKVSSSIDRQKLVLEINYIVKPTENIPTETNGNGEGENSVDKFTYILNEDEINILISKINGYSDVTQKGKEKYIEILNNLKNHPELFDNAEIKTLVKSVGEERNENKDDIIIRINEIIHSLSESIDVGTYENFTPEGIETNEEKFGKINERVADFSRNNKREKIKSESISILDSKVNEVLKSIKGNEEKYWRDILKQEGIEGENQNKVIENLRDNGFLDAKKIRRMFDGIVDELNSDKKSIKLGSITYKFDDLNEKSKAGLKLAYMFSEENSIISGNYGGALLWMSIIFGGYGLISLIYNLQDSNKYRKGESTSSSPRTEAEIYRIEREHLKEDVIGSINKNYLGGSYDTRIISTGSSDFIKLSPEEQKIYKAIIEIDDLMNRPWYNPMKSIQYIFLRTKIINILKENGIYSDSWKDKVYTIFNVREKTLRNFLRNSESNNKIVEDLKINELKEKLKVNPSLNDVEEGKFIGDLDKLISEIRSGKKDKKTASKEIDKLKLDLISKGINIDFKLANGDYLLELQEKTDLFKVARDIIEGYDEGSGKNIKHIQGLGKIENEANILNNLSRLETSFTGSKYHTIYLIKEILHSRNPVSGGSFNTLSQTEYDAKVLLGTQIEDIKSLDKGKFLTKFISLYEDIDNLKIKALDDELKLADPFQYHYKLLEKNGASKKEIDKFKKQCLKINNLDATKVDSVITKLSLRGYLSGDLLSSGLFDSSYKYYLQNVRDDIKGGGFKIDDIIENIKKGKIVR